MRNKAKKYDFYSFSNKEEFELIRKKYPHVPKSILRKADIVRRGVRFTERALEKIRAKDANIKLTACILFQSHKEDQVEFFPQDMYLDDGTLVLICVAPPENDPYIIDLIGGEYYALYSDGTIAEHVRFYKKPLYYDKVTRTGELMQYVGFATGSDSILFCPYRHCHFWNYDAQCVFCDIDYNTKHNMKIGRKFKTRCTPEDIYDTTKEALKEGGRWRHFFMTGGSDPRDDFDREFEYQLELIKAMQQAGKDMGIDRVPLFLIASPFKEEQQWELKKAGLDAYGIYFEIWDREKFKYTCPGKEKYGGGWDLYLDRILKAVKIFGPGNVAAGFVPGVEMAPEPYGFGDDMDAALNSTLSGYEFLLKNGITLTGSNLTIEPGTVLYKIGMLPPPLEFYARLEEGRLKLLKKYKLSSKHMCWKHQPYGLYADCMRYS